MLLYIAIVCIFSLLCSILLQEYITICLYILLLPQSQCIAIKNIFWYTYVCTSLRYILRNRLVVVPIYTCTVSL